jgi:broad specificity phosphatase PhoE
MIHEIPKPEISSNFTIEDIHKIREWNYARLKDATVAERIADANGRAAPILAELEAAKTTRKNQISNVV